MSEAGQQEEEEEQEEQEKEEESPPPSTAQPASLLQSPSDHQLGHNLPIAERATICGGLHTRS